MGLAKAGRGNQYSVIGKSVSFVHFLTVRAISVHFYAMQFNEYKYNTDLCIKI